MTSITGSRVGTTTTDRTGVAWRARLARAAAVGAVLWFAFATTCCALVGRTVGRLRRDDGMSTAEYAVGTVAAVAFAAVLYKVVRSGAVQSALSTIIENALGITL